MSRIRLFFATDIHGCDICFKKFINAAEFYKAKVIILGGDITGKFVVPIINRGSYYETTFLGTNYKLNNEKELNDLITKIRNTGYYAYLTNEDQWNKIQEKGDLMEKIFNEVICESVEEWVEYADKKLKNKDVICLVQPGNDDNYVIDKILSESSTIINPNEKVLELDKSLKILSLGYSNITPWNCPRDVSEDTLRDKIENLMTYVNSGDNIIYNIHVPPYGTGIDEAPELDEEMRPKMGPGGIILTKPVGSTAVREAILKYQPILGLHGHIHEARGFAKLGKTLCINPGSEYQEGILRGVLVQISDGKIKDYIFTSG